MKKSFKWRLIVFLAMIAALFLIGGCKFQPSLEERREEYDLPVSVTYYTNGSGAYFGSDVTEKTLYLPDGAVAMNVGKDTVTNGAMPVPTRNNHTLIGWYEAAGYDDEGNPITENGEVVLKSTPYFVDGQERPVLKAGDEIKLYAKWQKDEAIYVHLVCSDITEESPFVIKQNGKDVTIENDAVLTEYPYFTNGIRQEPKDSLIPKANGYTMVGFYTDKNCTQEVEWPIRQSEHGDYDIYAKYIKGNWVILKKAADISKLFLTVTQNFYLANDIDCTGITVNALANFTSTLTGNGYTIKNLTINGGTVNVPIPPTIAAFGNIQSGASIKDVTFENTTFKCTLTSNRNANLFGLFATIADVESITNVTIKDFKFALTCEANAYCLNMYIEEEWRTEHTLFGGEGTDAEQVAAGLDVNITNANVTIEV